MATDKLNVGDFGDDVARLHEKLKARGFEVSPEEVKRKFYGPATRDAVRECQTRHGLEATGEVNDATAAALSGTMPESRERLISAALRTGIEFPSAPFSPSRQPAPKLSSPAGVVDEQSAGLINRLVEGQRPQPQGPFVVRGRIVYVDGKPFTTGLVRAYDKDLRSEELLGETVTDAKGSYEIRYDLGQFGRAEKGAADLQVLAWTQEGREVARSPIFFNARTEETVDLVVDGEVYRGPSEYERLVEELTPLLQGLSFAELTEDEKHQDITFLSGETGQDQMHIAFLIKAHRLMQKTRVSAEVFYGLFREGLPTALPGLLAQSSDVQRRALVVAISDNIIPVRFETQIDAILDQLQRLIVNQVFEQPAEEGGTRLPDLLGTILQDTRQQEAFLAAYVANTGPIEDFWRDLEAGAEFRGKVKDLQFTLQLGAFTGNHLPLVQELQRLKEDGKITALSDLTRFDEEGWLEIISKRRDHPTGFPPDVPGKDDQEKARNYAKTMTYMAEDAFPTTFITHRLAKDQLDGKQELLTFFQANQDFGIKVNRLENYLTEKPGAFDGIATEKREALKQQVKAMQRLYKVAPRYAQMSTLMKGGLDSAYAISRMGKEAFAIKYGEALGGRAQAKLTYEQAQQTTSTAMVLLAEYGISTLKTSMHAVPDTTYEQIEGIPDWPSLFGSLELCECAHCRSVYSPAAYLVDILHFLKDRRLVDTITRDAQGNITNITYKEKALPDGGTAEKSAKDVLFERRPDLGGIELTCENTNTPLPYVDLVNEVLEEYVAPFTPFTLDAARENDLNTRTLSTDLRNAFTPALSDQAVIALRKSGVWWTIDDLPFTYTIRNESGQLQVITRGRQTSGTPQEQAANPQYINREAYDKLSSQVFPWQLPFDLGAEEARSFLDHLGVRRHAIMEAFLPGDRETLLDSDVIAREYLGLTTTEANLINGAISSQPGAAEPGVWNLWGFSSETLDASHAIPDPADSTKWITDGHWLNVLTGRVDVFLQQSGLKYKDLLDLLNAAAINPVTNTGERTVTIQSVDASAQDTCELAKLKLVGLDEATAVKITRYVRLWRKLGWHLFDLDRAVTALNPGGLNDPFLKLSHLKRLHERLNVPVERLLVFWAPISTAEYIDHHAEGQPTVPSLYTRLFRNKTVINPPDPAFTEDPAGLTGKLSEHEGSIAAALGISAEDLSLLFNDADVIPRDAADPAKPDDKFTLDYLSRLCRHATLARALKLRVRDYLSILALYGKDPSASTRDTVLFTEDVDQIRSSGFSLAELDYVLRHTLAAVSEVAPTDQAIALVLRDIRSGLQTIAAENTFRDDPNDPTGPTIDLNGDLTRAKLALLNWDGALINQVVATFNDAVPYRASLAALPAGLVLPNDTGDELPGRISYDEEAKKLRFSGVMTLIRQANLKNLAAANDDYKAAVDALFEAPRQLARRNLCTFSVPDFSKPLPALPAGVTFPAPFKGKVYFDATAKVLHFRGAMTETERDQLLALSTNTTDSNHTAYQTAINDLFAAPDAPVPQPGDAFLTSADVDALFDNPTTPATRFELALKKLFPYLRTTLSRRLVTQKVSEALRLETEAAEKLLTVWIDWPAHAGEKAMAAFLTASFAESDPNLSMDRSTFGEQFDTYTLLHKIALVISTLELTPKQLRWVFEYGPDPAIGWPDLNHLPLVATNPASTELPAWERLWRLCQIRDSIPRGVELLDKLFALAQGVPAGATDAEKNAAKADIVNLLETTLGWTEDDMQSLVGDKQDYASTGLMNIDFPNDFRGERLLGRLLACFSLLRRLGMSAAQCGNLSNADITRIVAQDVRHAVRAKYDEAQWLKLAPPLCDVLREKRRAALMAYLVTHPDNTHRWRDVNDVYAHFLIDVEMSPCQMTSRIKQAISAVQLFVQRCLMHLEPEVLAGAEVDEKWREWKWMKNYRVWEANRKVFLYPENWIEPELRDDKTPFFKALESELLQSDLTKETAEEAFLAYLEKLDQVARLEVVGIYHQVEQDLTGHKAVDILHVFGRTNGVPHVYYYRQRIDGTYWTAWERVDRDIEGNHLIPVVWNRRLYLFWPIFTEKAELLQTGGSGTDPQKYWEIKLAWSERKQDKWSNKKTSSAYAPIYSQNITDDLSKFFFRWFVDDQNNLNIMVLGPYWPYWLSVILRPWTFRFVGCHAEPNITGGLPDLLDMLSGITFYPRKVLVGAGSGTSFYQMYFMYFRDHGERKLYLPAPTDTLALNKTPSTFLLLPHPDGASINTHPFFYQDDTRTFFVIPSEVQVRDWTVADQIDPGMMQIPKRYYEVPPVIEPIGPIINPADPMPFDPSFPIAPEPRPETPGVGGILQPRVIRGPMLAGPGGEPDSRGTPLPFAPRPGDLTALRSETMRAALSAMTAGTLGVTIFGESVGASILADTYPGAFEHGPGSKPSIPSFNIGNNYSFQTFYHPYVCAFVKELNRHGVDGLLQRKIQTDPHLFLPYPPSGTAPQPLDFEDAYEPHKVSYPIVATPYPVEDVDFNYGGGYALYNWELFFHTPLIIASRLSQNQRFEEAQKWFHYIFDPTDTSGLPKPQRYWRTKPFFEKSDEEYQKERIPNLLRFLANRGDEAAYAALTPAQRQELEDLEDQVKAWRKDPFKPHLIARKRTTAYQKNVVMKYIDNLIAWGDQLFRRDTLESINEATQLYILAVELLGKRPEEIPPRGIPTVHTYNSLEPKLDAFSNALVQIEEFVPPSAGSGTVSSGSEPPLTLPTMLYFCVPNNSKLLGYWDTVADRLFKVRHCMNIEGVVRQLPLFEPPIEPGLLVRAAAAGVDISSALSDINAALPHYRFNVMAQKATELCAEVKSLGAALLAALEKRDAEDLGLLRAGHEVALLQRVEQIKNDQLEEAGESLNALRKSRDLAIARYLHYQKLLGIQSPQVPAEGQTIPEQPPSPHVSIMEDSGVKMILHEQEEMDLLGESDEAQGEAALHEVLANIAHIVPNFTIEFWNTSTTFGGSNVGSGLSAFASNFRAEAAAANYQATLSAKLGQYALRAHDWTLQSNLAAKEIMQIDKQIVAAEIRQAIAERELDNHRRQMEQSQEVEEFLRDKYTNRELYHWMVGQISGIYFQAYQLTYDVAKRSERAYRHELALSDSNFIQFGYWDNLKKGLLAGERLHQDIKRMEVAYLEQNKREYEIVKHISVAQLDPVALVQLKQTGECFISIPEVLFDLDYPGHYMRRIKSFGVTIPCVTGPYTAVPCTLTLTSSSVRHSNTPLSGYARQDNDPRFTDSVGAIQSIVTSSGREDSGLFETNLRDERYLPFEGAGAISQWRIELPSSFRAFDYDTISDVVLHIRYTAREAGGALRQQTVTELEEALNAIARAEGGQGLARLFSARHEFSSEWHRFLNPPATVAGDQTLTLALGKDRFPYIFQGSDITIDKIQLFVKVKTEFASTHNESTLKLSLEAGTGASNNPLSITPWKGLLQTEKSSAGPLGDWTLTAWLEPGDGTHQRLDANALEDIVIVCHFSI